MKIELSVEFRYSFYEQGQVKHLIEKRKRWTYRVGQRLLLARIHLDPVCLEGCWLVPVNDWRYVPSAPVRVLDFWDASEGSLIYPTFLRLADASTSDEQICEWVNRYGHPWPSTLFSPDSESVERWGTDNLDKWKLVIEKHWPGSPGVHCHEIRRQARLLGNYERAARARLGLLPRDADADQALVDAVAAIKRDLAVIDDPAKRHVPRWHFNTVVTPTEPATRHAEWPFRDRRPAEPVASRSEYDHLISLVPYQWSSAMTWVSAKIPRTGFIPEATVQETQDILHCLYLELSAELRQSLSPSTHEAHVVCLLCGDRIRRLKPDILCGRCRRRLRDRIRQREARAKKKRRGAAAASVRAGENRQQHRGSKARGQGGRKTERGGAPARAGRR